jgi:DNA-binding XRE family transcriptional regulator
MGFGLNWFATINWLDTSVGSDDFSEAFQLGCKRMGQWFRDQGGGYPVIYIYAHENPDGIKPNTHILLHLPTGLIKRFVAQLGGWFCALNDAAIDIQPSMKAGHTRDERLLYMIKGAHHCVCKAYGGHRKRGGQGPINFKRSGVCQFLRNEFGGRHDKWGRPIRKEASEVKMLMSGDELRMKREHCGLTQTGLAKLVGLHRNSVSRLERLPLIRQTSSHALKSILKALGENTPDVYRF